jgi:hypothetical protein
VVAIPHWRDLVVPAGLAAQRPLGDARAVGHGARAARFTVRRRPRRPAERAARGPRRRPALLPPPGFYDDPSTHEGYPDNAERFLFFTRAAIEAMKGFGEPFDIVHAHDQQAAWAPCFLRTHDADEPAFAATATVFTIHNLGYQGMVDPWVLGLAGFPRSAFFPRSPFEYHGRVNFMKVGILFADMVSTVSPTYAREIQSNGEYGFGLEGVLRRRTADLRGILNGIDDREWDPATDPHLTAHFDRDKLDGKRACRNALALAVRVPARARLAADRRRLAPRGAEGLRADRGSRGRALRPAGALRDPRPGRAALHGLLSPPGRRAAVAMVVRRPRTTRGLAHRSRPAPTCS